MPSIRWNENSFLILLSSLLQCTDLSLYPSTSLHPLWPVQSLGAGYITCNLQQMYDREKGEVRPPGYPPQRFQTSGLRRSFYCREKPHQVKNVLLFYILGYIVEKESLGKLKSEWERDLGCWGWCVLDHISESFVGTLNFRRTHTAAVLRK